MIFTKTRLPGVFIIEPELLPDERGFFARTFCKEEFQNHGLNTEIVQCNISYNKKRGTFRGMHFQSAPFEEEKIVSCPKGSIFDVIVDLRRTSPSYGKWISLELSEQNGKMVYIPKGCAHGFQTLEDDTKVYYQMGEYYHPECGCGLRWNDPAINIVWPIASMIISDKDKQFVDFPL